MSKYKEPELNGYTKDEVVNTFKHFRSYRKNKERMWRLIRDLYNGDFWTKIVKKTQGPQIKPDTNHIKNVASNITNSVYAANYHANVLPRHYKDNDYALGLNAFINYKWDKLGMKSIYPKIGKSAVLYNFSGVQIGWSADLIGGSSHNREQGTVELQHIPHNELYLDGSVTNYQSGRALFINRQVSLYDLINEKGLKAGALAYKEKVKEKNQGIFISQSTGQESDIHKGLDSANEYNQKVDLLECFFKVEEEDGFRIDHIFIADFDFILKVNEDIKPKKFPIAILYGEEPDSDPYGTPLAWTIAANSIAINLLDSIEGTHAYATQNRIKLFNHVSGINYRSFSKYGNTPNMAFVVRGDPDKVVKYIDVQALPDLTNLKQDLLEGIQLVSGVDPRYSGRETGSIQTTGGTDISQQRIQSVTDATRIIALEVFTEQLTELVIDYYIQWGDKYLTVKRDRLGTAEEIDESKNMIDFKQIKDNKFDYSMTAAPYLPRNTIRLSEAADRLMEMQGQYQFNPPLITHEEWLAWKDFPQKELILQRIRGQAQQLDKEEITSMLLSFAGMVDKGVDPQDAVELLTEEKQMLRSNPGMGMGRDPGTTGQGGLGQM